MFFNSIKTQHSEIIVSDEKVVGGYRINIRFQPGVSSISMTKDKAKDLIDALQKMVEKGE